MKILIIILEAIKEFFSKKPWANIPSAILTFLFLIDFFGLRAKFIKILSSFFVKIFNLSVYLINQLINLWKSDIGFLIDTVLLILILALFVWLIFINIKLKKIAQADEEKSKAILEEEPKKEEKLELTKEHFYVLSMIAESKENKTLGVVYEYYQREFPNALMVDLKSIINRLVYYQLIRRAGSFGGDFLYEATGEGVEFVREMIKKNKK